MAVTLAGRQEAAANRAMKATDYDLEAERAVLGAFLLELENLPGALKGLAPEHFYLTKHRKMYAAMVSLSERGEPVDLLTFSNELQRRGDLDEVGGRVAIATMVEEAATSAHLQAYIRIVREKAARRELETLARNNNHAEVNILIERLQGCLDNLRFSRNGQGAEVKPVARELHGLLQQTFPAQPGIVGSGMLPRQALAILGGPPKTGKSALVGNLVLKRSVGHPWLSFSTATGRTLLIQSEIPEEELRKRFYLMVQDLDEQPPADCFFLLTQRGLKLDTPEGLRICRRLIEDTRADLFVVDPEARFFSGDENSVRDIGRLIGGLDELIQDLGVTVLMVHHTAKPTAGDPRQGGLRLRGSSALFAAADSVFLLDRAEGGLFRLTAELRHGREPEPLLLQRTDRLWFELAGPPQELLDVAALVRNTSLRWGQLIQAIQVDQNVSKRTAERLLDRAKKAGLIALDGSDEYHATATGRQETSGGELS